MSSVEELVSLPLTVEKAVIKEPPIEKYCLDEDILHDERVIIRHMNPWHNTDESQIGGSVESTAEVSHDAYIGADCLVLNKARVLDQARLGWASWVYEDALVFGRSQVSSSWVHGHAQIEDWALLVRSEVDGKAKVSDRAEFLESKASDEVWIRGSARIVRIDVSGNQEIALSFTFTTADQINTYLTDTEKLKKELATIGNSENEAGYKRLMRGELTAPE